MGTAPWVKAQGCRKAGQAPAHTHLLVGVAQDGGGRRQPQQGANGRRCASLGGRLEVFACALSTGG